MNVNIKYKILALMCISSILAGAVEIKEEILGSKISGSFVDIYSEISKIYPNIDLISYASTKRESVAFVRLDDAGNYGLLVNPAAVIKLTISEDDQPLEIKVSKMTFKSFGFIQIENKKEENRNLIVDVDIGLSFILNKKSNNIEIITSADGNMELNARGHRNDEGTWTWCYNYRIAHHDPGDKPSSPE